MSQLVGTSRMGTNFSIPDGTDEKLAAMLALYKSPATIRDMKQVYFYCSVEANTTLIEPMSLRYNVTSASIQNQLYYAPIGTTRELNIVDKVNDLLDIRVPKDKYVIEINLVECVIEADAGNWNKIPDEVARITDITAGVVTYVTEPTFNWADSLANPDASEPPRQTINTILQQGTKLSEPQTLYCRIKELSNGEPFNWSVTNSGAFSIDKSHQLLVRHGDINYAKLTLEFGHLVFTGKDLDYEKDITDISNNIEEYRIRYGSNKGVPQLNELKETYRNYKYVDYNTETFNVVTNNIVGVPGLPYQDVTYPRFYQGDGGIDMVTPDQLRVGGANNLVQPACRPPFIHRAPTTVPPTDPYSIQGKPLLYNQQSSRIGFRWLIRVVHLF